MILLGGLGASGRVAASSDFLAATVSSKGRVSLILPRSFQLLCPFRTVLKSFPHDSHVCTFAFASNVHHLGLLDIALREGGFHSEFQSSEWRTEKNATIRDQVHFNNETWAVASFKIKLTRKVANYFHLLTLPVLVSCSAALLVFLLPPRFLFQRLVLIVTSSSLVIYANITIANTLGNSAETDLGCFLGLLSILNILGLTFSTFVYFLASKAYSSPLPFKLASVVNGPIGKALAIELTGDTFDLRTELTRNEESSAKLCVVLQEEWVLFAVFIDRVCFLVALSLALAFYPFAGL